MKPPTNAEIAAFARREARRAAPAARVNPAQALEIERSAAAECQRMYDAQSAARDAARAVRL